THRRQQGKKCNNKNKEPLLHSYGKTRLNIAFACAKLRKKNNKQIYFLVFFAFLFVSLCKIKKKLRDFSKTPRVL
ncbi:MAG: hypothetical protein K6A98_02785, partial [Prevotella sp.]|nr:hypothetical protein [Prevotella sp.]